MSDQPLTSQELFVLVAEECYRDGKIEAHENQLLNSLARSLELERGLAVKLAAEVCHRFLQGTLGPTGPLDPHHLLLRVEQAIDSDGVIDEQELVLLQELTDLLQLGDEV